MRLCQKIYCVALRLFGHYRAGASRLLFVGDSLSAGCFPSFLVRQIRERGLSVGMGIVAKSGATTADAYDLLEKRLRHKPSIVAVREHPALVGVVVLLGGNDLKRDVGFQRAQFEDTLATMLSFMRERIPHAFLCLGTYPVPGPHPRLPQNSAEIVRSELNPAIRRVVMEVGSHLCELEDIFDDGDDLRSDGVHPTILGEKRMAEAWFKTVFPLLESRLDAKKGSAGSGFRG